jgi:hypothetical protein
MYNATRENGNRGITLASGVSDVVESNGLAPFVRSKIRTKININGTPNENGEIDLNTAEDLEISLYAARQFFSKDWGKALKQYDNKSLIHILEELNFTLRWNKDQFDDWSNLDLWLKDYDSKQLGRKGFDLDKTTYAVSTTGFLTQRDNSQRANPEDIKKLIKKIGGRQSRSLPISSFMDGITELHEYSGNGPNSLLKKIYNDGVYRKCPIVGHTNIASKMGFPIQHHIKGLSKMQGVEYLFGCILPEIQGRKFLNR